MGFRKKIPGKYWQNDIYWGAVAAEMPPRFRFRLSIKAE